MSFLKPLTFFKKYGLYLRISSVACYLFCMDKNILKERSEGRDKMEEAARKMPDAIEMPAFNANGIEY